MKISQINNTNFKAGTVTLNRIGKGNIRSVEAIEKIAEDKDMDIIISKNKKSKYLPYEDLYVVVATKDIPVIIRGFFKAGTILKQGNSCMITNKKAAPEELSVKIYNAAIAAIDDLEGKIAKLKGIYK